MANESTIFYDKTYGDIKIIASGSQDFSIFGEDRSKKELLLNYITLPNSVVPKGQSYLYKIVDNQLVQKNQHELTNINELKIQMITDSKTQLAKHLEINPLQFTNGKYYSVTADKQNLLNNAIVVYQMKIQSGLPAELKWNATGEECTIWTLEGITALALAIANYVEPLVTYQQAIEVQIRNCTTKEELDRIVIDYATV